MAYCLHLAFLIHHIEPGVLMGLRTRNDKIPAGERAFMLASIKKAWNDGDVPVTVRHFGSNKDKNKGGSG